MVPDVKEYLLNQFREMARSNGIDPMKIKIEKEKETGKKLEPEEEMKLLTLPPGQAATRIMPRATAGDGLMIFTRMKVTAGRRMNCDIIPVISDLGFDITSRNC